MTKYRFKSVPKLVLLEHGNRIAVFYEMKRIFRNKIGETNKTYFNLNIGEEDFNFTVEKHNSIGKAEISIYNNSTSLESNGLLVEASWEKKRSSIKVSNIAEQSTNLIIEILGNIIFEGLFFWLRF